MNLSRVKIFVLVPMWVAKSPKRPLLELVMGSFMGRTPEKNGT